MKITYIKFRKYQAQADRMEDLFNDWVSRLGFDLVHYVFGRLITAEKRKAKLEKKIRILSEELEELKKKRGR